MNRLTLRQNNNSTMETKQKYLAPLSEIVGLSTEKLICGSPLFKGLGDESDWSETDDE